MGCFIRKFKTNKVLENYEANALLEMASTKEKYEEWLLNHSWELYQHLIFIAVLETYLPECVNHWAEEVLSFSKPAIITNLKKGCKNFNRVSSIENNMMEPQMGADFEDYRIDEFQLALKTEMKKCKAILDNPSKKSEHAKARVELREISKVLNIVGEFVEPNRERFVQFYNDFKDAADEQDVTMLEDAIQRFVDTKPIFHED